MHLRIALLFVAIIVPFAIADELPKLPIQAKIVKLDEPHGTLGIVIKQLNQRSGMSVTYPPNAANEDCPLTYANGAPFWEILEAAADRTGNRIALHDRGRKIALEPRGKSQEVTCVSGPFRVVVRQVTGRYLLDIGEKFHEVQMDIHWEPRFPVFRIDSRPRITNAIDDRGVKLSVQPSAGRTQIAGSAIHETTVRLNGLTRESRKIALLAGDFNITAADKMLTFQFADLSAKPPITAAPQHGVSVTLRRFEKDDKVWEAEIEVNNPPGGPVFESFESWASENQLRLRSPNAAKSYTPDDYEIRSTAGKLVAIYRFNEDTAKGFANPNAKGWSLLYTTPSPMVEFKVPFELKDIPLP